MYNQYFVKKQQIGKNILLILICETKTLDMGALSLLGQEFKQNFAEVDRFIDKIAKQ